eukprot:scaffold23222_cov22-Prasinocladus_malaysianus.AAC.2
MSTKQGKKVSMSLRSKHNSTRMIEQLQSTKEFMFQVTLASGLQADETPMTDQPEWARAMIHAAGVIQRHETQPMQTLAWKLFVRKREWARMAQKVRDSEKPFNFDHEGIEVGACLAQLALDQCHYELTPIKSLYEWG